MNKSEFKIFEDLDGCLTDFKRQFESISNGIDPRDYEARYGTHNFWKKVDGIGTEYWSEMEWMPDGKELWNFIKDMDVEILSSPSRSNTSSEGKKIWVEKNLGSNVKLNLAIASKKKLYAAPNHILIDDTKKNIVGWESMGGIGIHHQNAQDTIKRLKEIIHL